MTAAWKPSVDLFAHTSNAKCEKFYAYGDAPHASGVDAFAQDWTQELAWACPPVFLMIDTIKKIAETKMMAILVIPIWHTAAFWNMVLQTGREPNKYASVHGRLNAYCKRPLLLQ